VQQSAGREVVAQAVNQLVGQRKLDRAVRRRIPFR
jgi:hypothetical protein